MRCSVSNEDRIGNANTSQFEKLISDSPRQKIVSQPWEYQTQKIMYCTRKALSENRF